MKRLLVKRLLVMALCAASLAVAAEARAGCLFEWSWGESQQGTLYLFGNFACASAPSLRGCVELRSNDGWVLESRGQMAVFLVRAMKSYRMANDRFQGEVERILASNGNNFVKAQAFFDTEMLSSMARTDGPTSVARIKGYLPFGSAPGLQVRESPTLAGAGGNQKLAEMACRRMVESFFDVFFELVRKNDTEGVKRLVIQNGGPQDIRVSFGGGGGGGKVTMQDFHFTMKNTTVEIAIGKQ